MKHSETSKIAPDLDLEEMEQKLRGEWGVFTETGEKKQFLSTSKASIPVIIVPPGT